MLMNIGVLCVVFVALGFAVGCFFFLKKQKESDNDEITKEMPELAKIIRDGAYTFMKKEYLAISVTVLIVAVFATLFIEKTAGLTFIAGAVASSVVCVFGMITGTYGNVRTTYAAYSTRNVGKTVQVALLGGTAIGVPVQAVSLLGLVLIPLFTGGIRLDATGTGLLSTALVNPTIMRISTYSLGCSLVAMFNRVAGGNFTKAADISADMVGKVVFNMPEDDSRMPNTLADFIGDLVNDIAGNCSDLLESFTATVASSLMIATMIADGSNQEMFKATILYPIILAGGGLLACLIGLSFVLLHKAGDHPSSELNIATYISAFLAVALGGLGSWYAFKDVQLYESFRLGWASPWVPSILGIVSGVAIGKITEYYTSTDYKPVKNLVGAALDGPPFLVTLGESLASRSTLAPVCIIGASLYASYELCGVYGMAIASLGMLSFVATTVSIDAFGPISDNAGGIAESCFGEREDLKGVRVITDSLDAVGNTTAAIGKGFAIGSAAFATASLIQAYVGTYSADPLNPMLNAASVKVIFGLLMGGVLVQFFEGLLGRNTIISAIALAVEGARQLANPNILSGKERPDYERVISLATGNALRRMVVPSIIAVIVPIVTGLIFGVEFLGGLLLGATIFAIPRAIFMGNSGGAWDNAKKYVEEGKLKLTAEDIAKATGKKPSDEEFVDACNAVIDEVHKTTVIGDTIGDTNKDVIGVALDIFIKMMSTVANNIVPIIVHFHVL
ncbi:sodium/proton-translocating pyrophosphatase [Candidatus Saccharibacteria bacterium]|nr:sodium/proton-translocating pyrophosphatase [Candidatus Saccharibacteria bacterium]